MNVELFITRRLAVSGKKSFSRLIIRIATAAITLSLAVMIIASSLVKGFRDTISDKVYGFWGHVSISRIAFNQSFDDEELMIEESLYAALDTMAGVRTYNNYARKAGIIKTGSAIEGIILKGVDSLYNWEGFERFLVQGQASLCRDSGNCDQVLVSRTTSERLNLKLGDPLLVYFMDQDTKGNVRQRFRKFKISGIYNTGMEEFDKLFAIVDLNQLRKLNQWQAGAVGGVEVILDDPEQAVEFYQKVQDAAGPFLDVQPIQEIIPNIFDWINLQKVNERIIMSLMILVAIINMVTSLLILILERTNMIGILKAIGAQNWTIRKIFLYHAAWIIGIGIILGNLMGILLCLLQLKYGFISLPEKSYYVTVAPVSFDWMKIIILNIGTLTICLLFLLMPSYLISKIRPIQAIRFE